MECTCEVDYYADDSEPLKCSSVVIRKANKGHVCLECGEVIPKGARYERFSSLSVHDEIWWTAKTCMTCVRIRDSYFKNGHVVGTLRDVLRECLGMDYVTGEMDEDHDTT